MATINNPLLTHLSGKIGPYAIYQAYGKTCIRRRWKVSKPPTPRQRQHHERFAATVIFFKAIHHTPLYHSWLMAGKKVRKTGYNLFVSSNIATFSGEGCICDFSKVCLTSGSLFLPGNLKIQQTGHLRWEICWRPKVATLATSHPDDRLQVALMKYEDDYTLLSPDIGEVLRQEGKAILLLREEESAFVHLYCYFRAADSEDYSLCRYFSLK